MPVADVDGLAIAYVRRQRRTRDRSWIVEQQVDGGAEKMLVDWPALNYDPVYSLDGTELAFASDVAGGYAVYRLRLSDGKSWRLTFGDGAARHPDYQPQVGHRNTARRSRNEERKPQRH